MTGKAFLTFVIVIAAVVAGAYYATQRTTQAKAFEHITSLTQIDGAQPVECDYPLGAYGNGSPGHLFIYQNKLRVNIELLDIQGFSGDMQALLATDGTRLIDPDSMTAGGGSTGAANVLNTVITQAPWSCSPWWFPDSSVFDVPNAVSF